MIGIAGPVRGGRCEATNLPWVVDAKSLAKLLRLKRVGLMNDLVANAHGIAALRGRDFVTLNKGARAASGNRALISAGTGLGMAGMGTAFAMGKLKFKHGDFKAMIKDPRMASPFVKSFGLMQKIGIRAFTSCGNF